MKKPAKRRKRVQDHVGRPSRADIARRFPAPQVVDPATVDIAGRLAAIACNERASWGARVAALKALERIRTVTTTSDDDDDKPDALTQRALEIMARKGKSK
jgi:hypothetical protein